MSTDKKGEGKEKKKDKRVEIENWKEEGKEKKKDKRVTGNNKR